MDKSGLIIFAYGADFNSFVVKDVIPGSPAEESGLQSEDIVVKVQGLPAHHYSLSGLNALLQKKSGKKIRMLISRKGERLLMEFKLRDLI